MKNNFHPIAIIGLSGKFPQASDIQKLRDNLWNAKDSVCEITEDRIKKTTITKKDYQVAGYLEDIDSFDFELFNFAPIEAKTMDPTLRLLIEESYKCFESSGRAPSSFKGTDTVVVSSFSQLDYFQHAEEFEPSLITGNSPEFLSAGLSRQFGLRGNSLVVNTSCSSSLAALELGCLYLQTYQADYALIACANLFLFPPEKGAGSLDLNSPTGKSKSFSEEADGMSYGECVGTILVKRLDDAIRDKDIIHSVIRGVGSNHNGDVAAGPTKPDSQVQKELLIKVWDKANIHPRNIGFIEAHGSGTKLGDFLELKAINGAFSVLTKDKHFCSLSTIKSNIGHCREASGIASVFKAILSVKYRELYPSLNFSTPSSIIDFESSAVFIQQNSVKWENNNEELRLAGVTSIGLSGTNYHMVLQEAPEITHSSTFNPPYLILLSGNSKESLKSQKNKLVEYCEQIPDLGQLSSTLIKGKDHQNFRWSKCVNSLDEIQKSLKDELNISNFFKKEAISKFFFISMPSIISSSKIFYFIEKYRLFKENFYSIIGEEKIDPTNYLTQVAFQASFLKMIRESGVPCHSYLPMSFGKIVFDLNDGKLELENLRHELSKLPPLDLSNLSVRADNLIANEAKNGLIGFIDLGLNGEIFSYLEKIENNDSRFQLLFKTEGQDPFLEIVSNLYNKGINLKWNFIGGQISDRFEPVFPYEMKNGRCWIRENVKQVEAIDISSNNDGNDLVREHSELHSLLYDIWIEKAGVSVKSIHDNFFEIGGDSLKASKVIIALRDFFKISIDFEDLFDFPTIDKFVHFLNDNLTIENRFGLIWRKVLSVEEINRNDHFFEIGGHSLIANKLIQKIRKEFQINLNFEDIFNSPRFYQLVQLLIKQDKKIIEKRAIKKTENKSSYPLSSNQRRIYFIGQFENGSVAYNESLSLKINHSVDPGILEKSVKVLIKRHEILRTIFKENENGDINQFILEYQDHLFKLDYLDLSGEIEIEEKIEEKKAIERSQSFSFENGPLFRVSLTKINDSNYVINVVMHHIIVDSWSMNIFINELLSTYSSIIENIPQHLSKLDIQYKDYSVWEHEQVHGELGKKNKMYWLEKLKGELPLLELPYDFSVKNEMTYTGGVIEGRIDSGTLNSFKNILFTEKTTLFMGFLSSLKLLLFNYTGSEDIIVGSPIAGRDYEELENQLGFYSNTLALRTTFDSKDNFKSLLAKVKSTCLEAEEHKVYPFDFIVNDLNLSGSLSHNPLFDVALAFQNIHINDDHDQNSIIQNNTGINKNISKFDLTFDVFELEGELLIKLEFSTDRFLVSTAEKILEKLIRLINKVVENPDKKIYEYCSETSPELFTFWEKINKTTSEYPKDKSIIELFHKQVLKYPDKIGLVSDAKQLSYRELNDLSNQFARYLSDKQGFEKSQFVCIQIERNEWTILSILSILKLGKVYVPIQIDEQVTRNALIINDLGNCLLINEELITEFKKCKENYSTDIFKYKRHFEDLAYVMYTSGTTGNPKGVMIENKGVVRLVKDTNYLSFDENLNILSTGDPSFDATTFEYWGTLLNGGTLVLTNKKNLLDPHILEAKIIQHNVNTLFLTTGLANELIDLSIEIFSSIKSLFIGGELISNIHVTKLRNLFPNLNLYNIYGPTENTTFSLSYKIRDIENTIPIGLPISNTTVYLLDKQLNLVKPGFIGEIYLGGDGLAKGYLNNEELTSEKFITHEILGKKIRLYRTGDIGKVRRDGNIEILGRNDDQIKLRGFRIETKEIENNLSNIQGVNSSVVLLIENNHHEKKLVAFIKSKETIDVNEIKEKLKIKIPSYMIPDFIIPIESIPLNITGKVDKNNLKEIFDLNYRNLHIEEFSLTEKEREISTVWCAILGVERVSINKDFFSLGGNSLLALKLISKLRKELGMKISIIDIYNNATIQELAKKRNTRSNLLSFYKEFDETKKIILFLPPVFGSSIIFQDMAFGIEDQYNCFGVNYKGFEEDEKLSESIQEIASNISIELLDKLKILPQMDYPLSIVGYSMGALVAFELAKILEKENIPIVLYLIDRSVKLSKEEEISTSSANILLNNFQTQLDEISINQIHFREFYFNNCRLINNYCQTGKINGDIYVFESEANEVSSEMINWKELSDNGLMCHKIKGDHWQALESENVKYLSKLLIKNS